MKTPTKPKVIIIGGGVSALVSAMALSDDGAEVFLFTKTLLGNDPGRAESCINLAADTRGAHAGDFLFQDILKAGAGLSDASLVRRVVEVSQKVPGLLLRLGVQLDLTGEGFCKVSRAVGTTNVYSYSSTTTLVGQQILNCLVDQVKKRARDNKLFVFERWDFLSLVKGDTGSICGIVAENQADRGRLVFKADAVVNACGNGDGEAHSLMQANFAGATLANIEFTAVNPYVWRMGEVQVAVPAVLLDESVDFSVTRHGEPFKILKEWNASDVAHSDFTEVYRALFELKNLDEFKRAGIEAFLDLKKLVHTPLYDALRARLLKLAMIDINAELLPVNLSLGKNLGGLCVDEAWQTTVPHLYAISDAAAGFHGAGEISGSRLLFDFCSGMLLAADLKKILPEVAGHYLKETDDVFHNALHREKLKLEEVLDQAGPENIHELNAELQHEMQNLLLWGRDAEALVKALNNLKIMRDRFTRVQLTDRGKAYNRQISVLREFPAQLDLAEIKLKAALARQESRGAHLRRDFLGRDDRFSKPSLAVRGLNDNRVFFESDNVVKLNAG